MAISRTTPFQSRLSVGLVVGAWVAGAMALGGLVGCGKPATPAGAVTAPQRTVAQATTQTAASCRDCHTQIFDAWKGTDHALANRLLQLPPETAALATFPAVASGGSAAKADLVLGHKPLWQPLVPAAGGRWQPHELAYDPVKKDWFNVFGSESRQVGEWGHWTGRGMNWNSMCAHCHMTGYQKNYDAAADAYRSTWVEHGISCIQCHGPTADGHGDKAKTAVTAGATAAAKAPFYGDRTKMMHTCAPCHARNEQLTLDFQPGDNYSDHYRVTLPVDPGVFFPDGQQREEDFNWTSMLLSRMGGHGGVTCLDCHDPHTSKTILPTNNNALCLQCHGGAGRVQPNGVRAVPIDPVAHSRHAEGSAGNSCIACHMPTTDYMQRAPRHDHGWLKPDPLLTKELGIPNACSKCHGDKPIEWTIAKADEWFGAKLESRQRQRARAVAAAQAGRPDAAAALLTLLKAEDIPAWRATYFGLLVPYAVGSAEIIALARDALAAKDPMERAAAVRVLAAHEPARAWLRPLLKDPVRLVRLDVAWQLSGELAADSPERRELDAYLALSLDQPSGRLRLGQDLANRGQMAAAEREIARAAEWDPYSGGILDAHGMVLANLGRSAEAAGKLYRAAELQPNDPAAAMRAGLAFAEAGKLADAEMAFRLAVTRDAKFERAWYNLGLLQAQQNRLPEAAESLAKAAALAPAVADYPYALATVRLRQGDRAAAKEAAQRALQVQPAHEGARQILRTLP